jgi:hypothetical protein
MLEVAHLKRQVSIASSFKTKKNVCCVIFQFWLCYLLSITIFPSILLSLIIFCSYNMFFFFEYYVSTNKEHY